MGRKKIVRPESEKIKSILITKTAIKELVSEEIVEKVIMFQFKDFRNMVFEHNQIEITGFGKFLVSPNKVAKKKERMNATIKKFNAKLENEMEASDVKKEYWKHVVKESLLTLENLKTRIGGYENKH